MMDWIAHITAASLLGALALTLTPPGRVQKVTRLVCGLVCALAVAGPVARLDTDSLARDMALYRQRASQIVSQAEEEGKMLDRTYIEQRCQAYILGKAAQAGVSVGSVTVTARWDEQALLWYPWQAALDAPFDSGLAASIEGELGIPVSRQEWRRDG